MRKLVWKPICDAKTELFGDHTRALGRDHFDGPIYVFWEGDGDWLYQNNEEDESYSEDICFPIQYVTLKDIEKLFESDEIKEYFESMDDTCGDSDCPICV